MGQNQDHDKHHQDQGKPQQPHNPGEHQKPGQNNPGQNNPGKKDDEHNRR
jgi:hypothetical protein